MRPSVLVGIENTERRRDLTGPTANAEDRKIAPRVGGLRDVSSVLRDELMPQIERRYRTAGERAIVGESLAGLFVVETLLVAPELFDTYIAFDPSLWWNDEKLTTETLKRSALRGKTLYLATSNEAGIVAGVERFVPGLEASGVTWTYRRMPEETHGTIYHAAALAAFREMFAPHPGPLPAGRGEGNGDHRPAKNTGSPELLSTIEP